MRSTTQQRGVFTLAAWQVEADTAQYLRSGKGAVVAVPDDQVVAPPGRLDDADALGQHRPGGGLVGRVEPARPKAGQLRLGVGQDRIAPAHVRPGASVDVQGQEATRLRGGHLEIAGAGHDDTGRAALLGYLDLGPAPVALDTEDRTQLIGLALLRQRCGGEALPEGPTRRQRPRPAHLHAHLVTPHRPTSLAS